VRGENFFIGYFAWRSGGGSMAPVNVLWGVWFFIGVGWIFGLEAENVRLQWIVNG